MYRAASCPEQMHERRMATEMKRIASLPLFGTMHLHPRKALYGVAGDQIRTLL